MPSEDVGVPWAMTAAQVLALVMGGYLMWALLRDDPRVALEAARVRSWWRRKTADCEPCRRRKERLMANRVIYAAMDIVGAHQEGTDV